MLIGLSLWFLSDQLIVSASIASGTCGFITRRL